MINVNQITSKLALMPDAALKQFAEMHKEDPYSFSLAIAESNRRKEIRSQASPAQPQPKVADQELHAMAQPSEPYRLPEDVGIGALPVDMRMASGGIVAFNDGGMSYYDKGGTIRNAGSNPFTIALAKEGVQDPRQVAFLKAIYGQESTSGKRSETSNRGAVGGMQILPDTFDSVADEGMDIKDPVDNARAGIRYALQGYQAAKGNPELAGAYYYGGPKGMENAAKGIARSDPKNPEAPTTIGYGKDIARRMAALMPIGSAQAEEVSNKQMPPEIQADRSVTGQLKTIGQGIAGIGNFIAPEGAGGYTPGTRNFFERAADNLGISEDTQRNVSNTLNALPGVSMARFPKAVGTLSSGAQAAREADVLAAAAKAEQAASQLGKTVDSSGKVVTVPRLAPPSTPAPKGIEALTRSATEPPLAPRTTFPVGEDALRLKQQQQAAAAARTTQAANEPSLGAKMELDKRALQAADEGAAATFNAAKASEAAEMANAARLANATNRVTTPINRAANANAVNTSLNALDANDPRRTDANPKAVLNTPETKDFAKDMPVDIQNLENRYPLKKEDLTKEDKKDIIAQAKEASPELKSRGLSDDDWLHLGFALMGGQSQYALTNLGQAGLSTLAAKAEREKQANQLAMYKAVHASGGETTKMIAALRAEDPTLTYQEAMTMALNAKTGADIKQQRVDEANIKDYHAAKDKLDGKYLPAIRSGTGEYAQKMNAAYNLELKKLQEKFKIKTEQEVAPAALPLKVLNKQ
jgi:hypothetical protein